MSDGAFCIGGYPHDEPRFDMAAEIAKATGKWLADNAPPLTTDEIPPFLLKVNRCSACNRLCKRANMMILMIDGMCHECALKPEPSEANQPDYDANEREKE